MEGTHGDGRRHAGTAGDTRGPELPSLRGDSSLSPAAPGDTGSGVSLPSPPGTERSPRDPPGDTEPDGDKVCAVCGDRANGYHFHVMSCEGCKGFFRRSIIKGVRFTCPLARRCPVTKAKRRQCQACRLQKCLDVGMRRDMIMSEEALRRRRELRGQRGQPGGQRGQPGGQRGHEGLTAEQQELIALLIGAHQRTFDSSFSQFMRCWPAVRLLVPSPPGAGVAAGVSLSLSPCEEALPDVLSLLPQFADLSTFMIQQEFAAGGADLAAERSHAGHLRDPLQHRLQPRHQGLGVRPALLHHPRRGPGGIPAGVPGASAQVPREPAAPAAARGRVRPAAGHAALLARPRRHRPARRHRPVPGAGGADPAELHRAPAPPPRGQVPVRQAAAAADGAADADGGEHAADPAHPGPVGHDAAALRDHQLSAAPVPPPGPQVSPPAATRHRVKLLYLSGLPGVSPQGN
ncbi:nuclear receptor subfamily 1 group I member 3 isoform X1 [Passer montanus]|uniref:nuclear receptor subfamily 1 group I member 3 isoform X1 n=1 Tax=Passer montanus TaxID=9160 RepID=UPI00195F494A|nr:nuclear receptor subfamily 1 group I member 3 isoform X1 [Passer montanus]